MVGHFFYINAVCSPAGKYSSGWKLLAGICHLRWPDSISGCYSRLYSKAKALGLFRQYDDDIFRWRFTTWFNADSSQLDRTYPGTLSRLLYGRGGANVS